MFEKIFRNAIEYQLNEQYDITPFARAEIEFTEDGLTFVDFSGTIDAINADIERHTYKIGGFIATHSGTITITTCYYEN